MPDDGSVDHGGNCLGRVLINGQFPARAEAVIDCAALRSRLS